MNTAVRRTTQLANTMSGSPRPLKILMLHGYTQSGELFHAKTRALEKHLQKLFPGCQLSYPTGPRRLRPSDIPGFDTSTTSDTQEIESFGWWQRSDDAEPVLYVGFEDGMAKLAETLATEGPFDGVIGFSQGACASAMVASLLEGPERRKSFEKFHSSNPNSIPFPTSFEKLDHPPLKFFIPYSGFAAPGERYQALYNPHIMTPACHFLGSLDTLVDEAKARTLIDACGGEDKTQVVWHPGGHFLPSSKQYLNAASDFIKGCLQRDGGKQPPTEEKVEDMDVPF